MDLTSHERFAFPVGVFFQPLLLACLNVLRDGSHGLLGISIRKSANHLQVLVVHSRQRFGIVPGMAGGKDADQIPHLAKELQRHRILGNDP